MLDSIAICTDCLEGMRKMEDESVDLTVTSPPYDSLRDYKGYSFDWKQTLDELLRVTKKGGVVVWIVNDSIIDGSESGTSFRQALYAKEIGFYLHDTMIWNKGACAYPDANRYYGVFEYMFVLSKGKPKTFNPIEDKKNVYGGKRACGTERQKDGTLRIMNSRNIIKEYGRRNNVWDIGAARGNDTGHPAVFPLNLVIDHINTWSNPGELVMDPFLGSGTTRIAAYRTGRRFIGYEISQEYFDAQEKRWKGEIAQTNLFDII